MNTARRAARQDHAADPVLRPQGAEFTVVNGWERVDYFKPTPISPKLIRSVSTRSSMSSPRGESVQSAVGLAEVNGFNRIEITGKDAHAWLDQSDLRPG